MPSIVSHCSIIDREPDSNILTNETKLKLWCPWVWQLNTPLLCVHLPQNPTCGIFECVTSFLLSLRCWVELSPACTQGTSGTHPSRRSGTTRWKSSNWRWGDRTWSWTAERYWPFCSCLCEIQLWLREKKTQTGQFCLGKHCSLLGTELKQFWSKQGNGRFWIDPCRAGWAHNSRWQRTGVTLGCFLKFSS